MKHKNLDLKKIDVQPMNTTEMMEQNGGVVWVVIGYLIAGIATCSALIPILISTTRNIYYSVKEAIKSDKK